MRTRAILPAKSAVDCKVTAVSRKIKAERAAAKEQEKEGEKWRKYEKFLQKCKAEDPWDPRLRTV